jgi:thiol-disulfide isomerase/thioredoxin
MLKANLLLILCFLMVGLVSLPEVIGAEKAYEFTLVDTEEREFSLSDFRGKYVLIDFFAIWCAPCKIELEHLKDLKHQLGDDVVIISIDVDPEETEQQIKDYKQANGMDWIVAKDTEFLSMPYRVTGLPTLVLIDPSGNIVNTYVGVTDETLIMREIPIKPTSESPTTTGTTVTTTGTTEPPKSEQSSNQNWLFLILLIIAIIIGWMIIRKRGKKRKK